MKTQPEEVIDRYNAAKLLRRIELTGVAIGVLMFIAGIALTAFTSPYDERDAWNSPTAVVAAILFLSGPLLALWILTTLSDGEQ